MGENLRHHRRAADRTVEFANRYNEPGSSPGTDIVPQPRCEPINASLIERNGRSSWPPDRLRLSHPDRNDRLISAF